MTVFAVIAFFGMVALVVGIIGLIVSAIRHTKKTRWLIVLLVGLVVAIIFTVAYGATMGDETSDTTEETVVEEEVVADEESESAQDVIEEEVTEEPAEEVVEEVVEEPAVTWIVDDKGKMLDTSVVSGGEKYVTLKFEYNGRGVLGEYLFERVTIGDTVYRVDDGTVDGFEGLPIITKEGDKQYDRFVPGVTVYPDEPVEVTYTMNDGSNLPDKFEFMLDSSEVAQDPWSGGNKAYTYQDVTLTIEKS